LVFLAFAGHNCPYLLFGPGRRCVTCQRHPCYHVLVIANMRCRCNGQARGNVSEGVETARRISKALEAGDRDRNQRIVERNRS
jgi:hypothetical protein